MSESQSTALLVDDDQEATRALIRALGKFEDVDIRYLSAQTASCALDQAAKHRPEVAVVDLSLDPLIGPDSGLELIPELHLLDPTIRILVLTGHGSAEFGVKALQRGAASFIEKPADPVHLFSLIKDAVAFSKLKRSYLSLSQTPENLKAVTGLNSRNRQMLKVIESVAYAASNNQPVLLIGETGTGKGLIAQAIHRADTRQNGACIRFQPNFGSHDMVASELFGHKRGAFTGATEDRKGLIEEARRGTLFVDEVDELPQEVQVLLLNVLQERTYRRIGDNKEIHSDFRLISATNRPHSELISSDCLRQDFYHRIAHFTLEIPPLRERVEDIPSLANGFIQELTNRENIPVQGLTIEAEQRLCSHAWPGNVRELQAVVQGGVYRANYNNRRFVEAVDIELKSGKSGLAHSMLPFRERIHQFELQLVTEALKLNSGNQQQAADSLAMNRSSLKRILARSKS